MILENVKKRAVNSRFLAGFFIGLANDPWSTEEPVRDHQR